MSNFEQTWDEYLEDLKTEQEELEECGDLEDRFEMAMKVGEVEDRIDFLKSKKTTEGDAQ